MPSTGAGDLRVEAPQSREDLEDRFMGGVPERVLRRLPLAHEQGQQDGAEALAGCQSNRSADRLNDGGGSAVGVDETDRVDAWHIDALCQQPHVRQQVRLVVVVEAIENLLTLPLAHVAVDVGGFEIR